MIQECLNDLPDLVTLHITTWPNNLPSTSLLPRKIYEQLLAGLAQFIFKGRPKLAVIAFGSSDKVYDREDSKNQVIFVRGKQVDPLRNETVCAIQIGWCLRRYVEPRSEVLDFSLSRSSRPPTRDSPASDDSDV